MEINPGFQRLTLLTGNDAAEVISKTRVMVFGLGGVGSWCAEALARSGIGSISIVDHDKVEITNLNRQIEATRGTIGQLKTLALYTRLKEINGDCEIRPINAFFSRHNAESFGIPEADYLIDAIDSLESKLDLIECAVKSNVTLYSSMGMARKLDPTRLRTADIWKTSGCPLAALVREGLRKRGFTGNFTAVYSEEKIPQENLTEEFSMEKNEKKIIGSSVTVTATAGMILASLVIRNIIERFRKP